MLQGGNYDKVLLPAIFVGKLGCLSNGYRQFIYETLRMEDFLLLLKKKSQNTQKGKTNNEISHSAHFFFFFFLNQTCICL